jgi:hypothetical protein
MWVRAHFVLVSALVFAVPLIAQSQAASPKPAPARTQLTAQSLPLEHQTGALSALSPRINWELEPLVDFKNTAIKFNLQILMNTLRDNRHEGWVLAAYPDPKTSRPLIGAGFSLDLDAREHIQGDPLNPTLFLEPSSAQLWEAAGLEPGQLDTMLEQYDRDLTVWQKKKFRRKIRTGDLFPQISEEDATALLRISAIQSIHNAQAYCRYFDQLSGSQQMGLSQMVYQMGVNLEQFTNFLSAINTAPPLDQGEMSNANIEYWRSVQGTLIHTDWARRYSTRAISVIAMFDPAYATEPYEAEARVRAEVHPLHRHRRRRDTAVRTASLKHHKSANRTRKG